MTDPKPRLSVAPLSEDRLRQYVLDILSGQVLTSDQVRARDMGMVFMPLIMGALSPPDEVIVKHMGSAEPPETLDGDPPKPEHPGYPEGVGEPPTKPVLGKIDPQVLRDLDWGEITEVEVDGAKAIVEAENTRLVREWDAALMAWDRAIEAEGKVRCEIDATHEAAIEAWEAKLAVHTDRQAERQATHDEWVARFDVVFDEWRNNIAVVAGNVKDTFPRSINGYPMFHAIALIGHDDWKRIRAAVIREQDRAKTLEV